MFTKGTNITENIRECFSVKKNTTSYEEYIRNTV